MIKTIDEAVEVLNKMGWQSARWIISEFRNGQMVITQQGAFIGYNETEAIAIARSLNGDYEALEAESQQLREDATNGAGWFDAFQRVDSGVMQIVGTDNYVVDSDDPSENLLNSISRLREGLQAENASLSSKLERARMELRLTKNNLENVALEAALIGKPMPLEILQDWVSQGVKSVSAALAETEEEKADSESTACGKI